MALLSFSVLILIMIILEATTGGTLTQAGYWTPWIIFPIYVFLGFFIGETRIGFMTICIVLSVLSVIICAVYLLFAKIKPTPEEEAEQQQKQAEMKELSENPIKDDSNNGTFTELAPKDETTVTVTV
ncbi:hypothetical protein C9374_008318 [Naegleria lovaniensis]|uniref:Uncharacterized protein n=1 Tax=Naegleria lovaniensis TaxID=51637 RepID=A0AA88KFX6_NAELO|nr:uncharacterized protein C9374_008318 [Naegleria lovaniensis]KAG2378175.1 hypothetical protein C9374_008318 [Naegleria lovaniensis]